MKKNNLFWGIVFILAAFVMIAGKLGYLGEINVFTMIISVFLLAIIIKSIHPISISTIIFPLAFLGIIFNKQLGIQNLTPWTILIVATLLTIGLSLIFKNKVQIFKQHVFDEKVIDMDNEEKVMQKTTFAEAKKYVNSNNFKRADFDCSFGSLVVYFENVKIPSGNAIINVQANFGEIQLFIPKEWKIENQINPTLGSVSIKNRPLENEEIFVKLVGNARFGHVEIIYV